MMGFANLPMIVHKLMEHGMSPDRGCAVISHATRFDQKTVAGTLRNIEVCVRNADLATPALIVVGDVVGLHDTINWFETKPLFGKRIVVTRAREQSSDLKRMLEESGAQVVQFPMISIEPPASFESLDRAIDERFDWLVFTSSNGVRFFFDRLFERGKDARALSGVRIAAVGSATANDLRARGIIADVVPERFISTELLPLLAQDQRGVRTAVIRAEEGREELLDELRRRGGDVHLAIAYRNVATDTDLSPLGEKVDAITFTSASTVDNFLSRVTDTRGARLVSIGPATSAAIRKHGLEPDIEAKEATIQALHDALL
jgi:uroporphyrinogen III methyltransferase/synthase